MDIQQMFNKGKTSGEFKGPLIIDKKCEIDANGATVWTKDAPAVIVEANGVTIKNLKVELTKGDGKDVAVILKNKNVKFENVEVFGEIQFEDGSKSNWDLPRVIDLGEFRADTENIFARSVTMSEPVEVINDLYGLTITDKNFKQGENVLTLKIAPLRHDTIIYGSFVLKTNSGILKRVYVSGKAVKNGNKFNESIVKKNKLFDTSKAKTVLKGERIKLNAPSYTVAFVSDTLMGEVNPYLFLLHDDGKVKRDEDLIFFNNPRGDGVFLENKYGISKVTLKLSDIPKNIAKIAITFAVYDEEKNKKLTFNAVKNPEILIFKDNEVIYSFPMHLALEKAMNAIEIYRHKCEWKANFVGAGFFNGIRELCKLYGVNVV